MPFENKSNLQVVEAISKGFRLYRPRLAPMSIYEVMYRCWHEVSVPRFPVKVGSPSIGEQTRGSHTATQGSFMAGKGVCSLVVTPESQKHYFSLKFPLQSHQSILFLTMAFH